MAEITYRISPQVTREALKELFSASWPGHTYAEGDVAPILKQSLVYVCVHSGERLIGFVNVAWDGGIHAFILDTTVHPKWRRQGLGLQLVKHAAAAAKERGIEWLHVDFEPHLRSFYQQCGFRSTEAGLMNLHDAEL